ncbi:hypothetical protein K501DRAFT_285424, partial [Backusella circina FSU 941]
MFRTAKKLSKHLKLKKSHSDGSDSDDDMEIIAPNRKVKEQPFLIKIDRVSTRGSISSSSSSDEEASPVEIPNYGLKRLSSPLPQLSRSQTTPNIEPTDNLEEVNKVNTNNLDLLLSMETQERVEALAERKREELVQQKKKDSEMLSPRPTAIKFELPVTPPRSRSPTRLAYPRARPIRSLPEEGLVANVKRHPVPVQKPKRQGWRTIFGDRDEENPRNKGIPITLNTRVKLTKRPLPTFGIVKYMGEIGLDEGVYFGIELDHGVG